MYQQLPVVPLKMYGKLDPFVLTDGNLSYHRLRKRNWKPLTWAIERVRTLRVIVCISPKKWPKRTTAGHLSTNSKTKVVASLKKAYPSEGVSTLNVAKLNFWRLSAQCYISTMSEKQKLGFTLFISEVRPHPIKFACGWGPRHPHPFSAFQLSNTSGSIICQSSGQSDSQ